MASLPVPPRLSRAAPITIGVVAIAIVTFGVLVGPAAAPLVSRGARAFPRVPGPPADARGLLRALGVGSVAWYACAAALPACWWLARRLPLTLQRVWRSLVLQLGAVLALIAVTSLVHYAVTYHGAPSAPSFGSFVQVALVANALPLLAVAALANVFEARRRAVHDALDAQRLRAELAESRLIAVTSQLQPHFLFNTLQSISTLIHRDPVAADAMLARLSDLLRDVLRRSHRALVPFSDELRMTKTYLELAQVRFGDRLQVTIDAPDDAQHAMVPILLLQPLVENALKHGVGRRAAGGCVAIVARKAGDRLIVTVRDDGAGTDEIGGDGEGIGLANTRERLRHAFGDDQSLVVRERAGGVEVTIDVPMRVDTPPG